MKEFGGHCIRFQAGGQKLAADQAALKVQPGAEQRRAIQLLSITRAHRC
jgi:hypothetical protein